jgi:DNA polymerase-1
MDADLVFFQHDEVIVHCRESEAAKVAEILPAAADRAGHMLFGDTGVHFVMDAKIVGSYADAK